MHSILYLSTLLTASAAYVPLRPRAYSDPCVEDVEDHEQVFNDAVTADGTAGIGAEFESPFFYFVNPACSVDDTNDARKKVVAERTGTNWMLTADTGASTSGGKLNAEYILDGRNIKVGGDGDKTAKALADDLIAWKPWQGTPPNNVNIEDSKCNPWRIDAPNKKEDPARVPWDPQITTPMPLEALYILMKEQKAISDPLDPKRNILDGDGPDGLLLVTKDFFQSSPNGIDGSRVTDDVLGFCSLVLSYGKVANRKLQPNASPKLYTTFMPRTEFNTLFEQVKSKIPGDLFDLFNILACYKDNAVLDTAYCKGPATKPVPNTKFAGLSYTNTAAKPPATVNIKDWISGIGKQDPSPDLLSKFDESIDGSIGGQGTKMEKIYNSQRSAPLFEFRNLLDRQTSQLEQFMKDVDSSIQTLHKDFADPPKKKKLKRDAPASCTMPDISSGPTSTDGGGGGGAPTVAPVDPPSQPSCVPTPTDHVKDAHEGEMQKVAKFFCDQYASNTNAQAPISITQTVMAGERTDGRTSVDIAFDYPPSEGNQDDVYDIKLTSVPNCTPKGGFNLATPVAKNNCADILHTAWTNCNNQGRGGDITAGCLVYSIHTKF